jgi:hypothetical protein
MSERPPPPAWQTLPQERQRGVILTLEQMVLGQFRHASLAEDTADERRECDRQQRERTVIVCIPQSTVQQVERHQESGRPIRNWAGWMPAKHGGQHSEI